MKHTVNGDQQYGWYCYSCDFFTRSVEEAAQHDSIRDEKEGLNPKITCEGTFCSE